MMPNKIHAMLTAIVALQTKEQLTNHAIKSLIAFKNSDFTDHSLFERAAKDCVSIFMKHLQGNKSFKEIMDETEERSKIAETAMEFNEMLKSIKKD